MVFFIFYIKLMRFHYRNTNIDHLVKIREELNEAVENERRVLNEYVNLIKTMDLVRYQELVKLWTYDIG